MSSWKFLQYVSLITAVVTVTQQTNPRGPYLFTADYLLLFLTDAFVAPMRCTVKDEMYTRPHTERVLDTLAV